MAHLPRCKAANPKKLPPAPNRKYLAPAIPLVAVHLCPRAVKHVQAAWPTLRRLARANRGTVI